MPQERTALVTGSTGGIGRAVAEALAADGCAIMLNGFGEADEIDALRAGLAERHGVAVDYDGADMTSRTRSRPWSPPPRIASAASIF